MAEHGDHITCRQVVDLVTEYLEGAMDPRDAELFEQHLNFCDGCVTYVDQMRLTIASAGRVHEQDVPPEARDKLLAAFRHWKAS